jgi:hypothetical protein
VGKIVTTSAIFSSESASGAPHLIDVCGQNNDLHPDLLKFKPEGNW